MFIDIPIDIVIGIFIDMLLDGGRTKVEEEEQEEVEVEVEEEEKDEEEEEEEEDDDDDDFDFDSDNDDEDNRRCPEASGGAQASWCTQVLSRFWGHGCCCCCISWRCTRALWCTQGIDVHAGPVVYAGTVV